MRDRGAQHSEADARMRRRAVVGALVLVLAVCATCGGALAQELDPAWVINIGICQE